MFKLLEERKNTLAAAEHIIKAAAFAVHGAKLEKSSFYEGADDGLVEWLKRTASLLDDLEARGAFYAFLDSTPVGDEASVVAEIEKRRGIPSDFIKNHKDETGADAGVDDPGRLSELVGTFAAVLEQEAEIAAAIIEEEKAARKEAGE